jgi:hypothetical protein
MLLRLGEGLTALSTVQAGSGSTLESLFHCSPAIAKTTPEVSDDEHDLPSFAASVIPSTMTTTAPGAPADTRTFESMLQANMKDFISNLPGCPAEILTQLLVVSEEGEDKALLQKAKCIKLVLTYRDWENGDSEKREDERFAVYQQILNLSSLLEGLPIDHSS